MKLLLLLLVAFSNFGIASGLDTVSVASSLPPLEAVLAAAVEHSPILKRESESVKMRRQDLKLAKNEWMRGVTLEATSQYGSYGDQSVNKLYLGNRVGASVKVSLEEIFSSGSKYEKFEAAIAEEEYNRENIERQLKEVVISHYVKIQTDIQLVAIATQGYNNAIMAKQNAETKYRTGELPLYDFSRILDFHVAASMTLERTQGELREQWMALEQIIGVTMASLRGMQ
jgi:outer membrane protein TolC